MKTKILYFILLSILILNITSCSNIDEKNNISIENDSITKIEHKKNDTLKKISNEIENEKLQEKQKMDPIKKFIKDNKIFISKKIVDWKTIYNIDKHSIIFSLWDKNKFIYDFLNNYFNEKKKVVDFNYTKRHLRAILNDDLKTIKEFSILDNWKIINTIPLNDSFLKLIRK